MDKALKQRLVGASVLIALAVIVLPMLLSGRPQGSTQQSQKIDLPPRPGELSFETRRFPVSDNPADATKRPRKSTITTTVRDDIPADKKSTPTEIDPTSTAGAADTTPFPVPQEVKPAETSPPPVNTAPPVNSDTRYVVQVASLGSAENASRLMKSLQQQGYTVLMDVVDSDVGRLNRVRVGPFGTESDASQASVRIDKEIDGVTPRVVDLQPDQSAPVTKPTDPLVRWVVQVGSFSQVSNADRLVEQLRSDGQSAYREAVRSSSSSIFRVRVGPFIEREVALRSQKDLLERLSMDGVVMSAD